MILCRSFACSLDLTDAGYGMIVEAKGALFVSLIKIIEATHGAEAKSAVLAALPGAFGERTRSGSLLASAWYPIAWNAELVDTAQQVLGMNEVWAQDAARQLLLHDLRGIYRLFVKMLSPEMLSGWTPRLFAQYYRGGSVRVTESEPGFTVVRYDGWAGFSRGLWQAVRGGSLGALEACGARELDSEVLDGGESSGAVIAYRWAHL